MGNPIGDPAGNGGGRWQLIDGEPVAIAPSHIEHGILQAELARLIGNHRIDRRSPCRVVGAPGAAPHVRANMNFRVPDLGATFAQVTAGTMLTDPVLLVEILSPGNASETWPNIWAYTTVPSVREILSVRSTRMEVTLLRRGPDGVWPAEGETLVPPAALDLESIGFRIPVRDLYRASGLTTSV